MAKKIESNQLVLSEKELQEIRKTMALSGVGKQSEREFIMMLVADAKFRLATVIECPVSEGHADTLDSPDYTFRNFTEETYSSKKWDRGCMMPSLDKEGNPIASPLIDEFASLSDEDLVERVLGGALREFPPFE